MSATLQTNKPITHGERIEVTWYTQRYRCGCEIGYTALSYHCPLHDEELIDYVENKKPQKTLTFSEA